MNLMYRALRAIAHWFLRQIVEIQVEGTENIPASGPCFLVPNHQSALDPLLVQGICPRVVDTMTKSTQFSSTFFRWLLLRGRAFPVRRYRVDPQAVRILLRRLDEGRAVCIYPEGERTWDGALQPLRKGTMRILLRCGVPIIPVGIEGMYDVWPRWASRPRVGSTVHLRFGRPLHFGAHLDREAREAALPAAERELREALLLLSGEAAPEVDEELRAAGMGDEPFQEVRRPGASTG